MKYLRNIIISFGLFMLVAAFATSCSQIGGTHGPLRYVTTVAGTQGEFGETFGVAYANGFLFVTDGQKGESRWFIPGNGEIITRTGLDTPSGICVARDGKPIVADSGRNAVYRVDKEPSLIAGIEGKRGTDDGAATSSTFNSPNGIACGEEKTFVADTYNDRIRVIENGNVRTIAGSTQGFQDGVSSMFDTPTGIAIWNDKLLVA
ncbi:MAG: hypothetical protein JNL64_15705, partial [Blastocatellia bacterium]|nr:hypothetical protein [Blastocatellia bacterium]